MYEEKVVLCGANSYEEKYYLNPDFDNLPDHIKDELKIMCVLYVHDVGGILTLVYEEDGSLCFEVTSEEGDPMFDEYRKRPENQGTSENKGGAASVTSALLQSLLHGRRSGRAGGSGRKRMKTLTIGNVELANRYILAPMAGVTDWAFRTVCARLGAGLTVTEMVSSRALVYRDRKSAALLRRNEGSVMGAQIFGSDPAIMAEAAMAVSAWQSRHAKKMDTMWTRQSLNSSLNIERHTMTEY